MKTAYRVMKSQTRGVCVCVCTLAHGHMFVFVCICMCMSICTWAHCVCVCVLEEGSPIEEWVCDKHGKRRAVRRILWNLVSGEKGA